MVRPVLDNKDRAVQVRSREVDNCVFGQGPDVLAVELGRVGGCRQMPGSGGGAAVMPARRSAACSAPPLAALRVCGLLQVCWAWYR